MMGLFSWFRRRKTAPPSRGPDWAIETPYGSMEGSGVVPRHVVSALREAGVSVTVFVDGTGNGLSDVYRRQREP